MKRDTSQPSSSPSEASGLEMQTRDRFPWGLSGHAWGGELEGSDPRPPASPLSQIRYLPDSHVTSHSE